MVPICVPTNTTCANAIGSPVRTSTTTPSAPVTGGTCCAHAYGVSRESVINKKINLFCIVLQKYTFRQTFIKNIEKHDKEYTNLNNLAL